MSPGDATRRCTGCSTLKRLTLPFIQAWTEPPPRLKIAAMPKPRPCLPHFHLLLFAAAACLPAGLRAQSTSSPFSQIIVFGDSLSDVGNDADLSDSQYGIRFPGPDAYTASGDSSVDYTDGRFTDGSDTDPAATLYSGVWHEQLAKLFLNLPVATASLDGGVDYAFGGAETGPGRSTLSEEDGLVSLTVDNIGQQLTNYLGAHTPDPDALYIVWGGANDLFDDEGDGMATYEATATKGASNISSYVQQLAEAGAKTFIVPNLPPLELTPDYLSDTTNGPLIKQATIDFCTDLANDLAAVQTTLTGEGKPVTIYQLDVYSLFERLLVNQASYGFVDIKDSSQTASGSVNPDQYLFWDGVHPTTAGHFQLAAEAYTVITGVPVVEAYPNPDGSGAYVTRTGTDITKKLFVNYAIGGTDNGVAIAGTTGMTKIGANQQTKSFSLTPVDSTETVETFKLKPGADYVLPVVRKAKIKLTTN